MMSEGLHKPGDTFLVERGPITTTQLVMYAGASGDFNRIHYDHPFAVESGLGGLLVHGMLTMAFAASCAVEAFGPASRISRLEARFTAPVRVGDLVRVTATVVEASGPGHATEATLIADVDGQVVLRGMVEAAAWSNETP
ncbi:MaoC family dehydratase [Neorhizobium tomejilense]|uniref:MaoC family dehydratase n=1 Tax=Neorhizobium tomejilense TaxID=2093828 RepID=UPI003ED08260